MARLECVEFQTIAFRIDDGRRWRVIITQLGDEDTAKCQNVHAKAQSVTGMGGAYVCKTVWCGSCHRRCGASNALKVWGKSTFGFFRFQLLHPMVCQLTPICVRFPRNLHRKAKVWGSNWAWREVGKRFCVGLTCNGKPVIQLDMIAQCLDGK